MRVGYAWVSTFELDSDLRLDAFDKEGCDRIFYNQGESGAKGICMKVGISRASYYRLVAPETTYQDV